MATNNIYSPRVPGLFAQDMVVDSGQSLFVGDPNYEQLAGMYHALSDIESSPMSGLIVQQRDVLLARAGIVVRRGQLTA